MKGMTEIAIAAHLRSCEEALLDPAVRKDRARVAALLADDFFEFGSSGTVWTREQILDLLATENVDPAVMEDFACCALADRVVLVTYRTVRSGVHQDAQVSDKIDDVRTVTLRSSIWVFGSRGWQVRFHQGTRANS